MAEPLAVCNNEHCSQYGASIITTRSHCDKCERKLLRITSAVPIPEPVVKVERPRPWPAPPEGSPNDRQVDGNHYQKITGVCPHCGGEIQHWDLYARMPYLEGQITKYVTRWASKNGLVDLEKAQHFLEKLISIVSKARKNA